MALYQNVSVTVTSLGGGAFNVQVGPEGYTLGSIQELRDMVKGVAKDFRFLLHQIALALDAAGFDPQGKTPAQIKTAVEALILKW